MAVPIVRYWDRNFNEIPYCVRCGAPHTKPCLRPSEDQPEAKED